MKSAQTKQLAIIGLLTALVTVATMAIKIPITATGGYVNLGDSMIFLAAILFGWRYGMIAGGLGSALADILGGYGQWAIPTLIVKGLMGLIVGKIADQDNDKVLNLRNILSLICGILWMTLGYYLTGAVMLKSFIVPLSEAPFNLIQGSIGALIFSPLGIALKKSGVTKKI
jgi:uncharacterized membrane protein